MCEVIDRNQKKMLEEMDAKSAQMHGNVPEDVNTKAMDLITADMSDDQKQGLESQISNERIEADKIFSQDDLNFENYDNLLDKKLPVDQELVDKYRKKMGILEKVEKEGDGKPKSITDFQDVIKNNQGAVKRQKKDDTKIDQSNDKKD
jgi:hypothetical protein